ncbi:hypothetical protein BH23GEM9_BH23GEM9_32340 [soil metagenome]
MDPVTHTLTGAALSRAGLNRTTPLATATLVIAANAPDIDIIAMARGSYAALALRRGLTHGPAALLLLPVIITAAVLLYDRLWRQRKQADVSPARALPLLALALIGVATHPLLDWMNTYGIRLLSPFSERWYYGDSLFIIDPWVWLILAAPLVAIYSASRRAQVLWIVLAIAATILVMMAPQVPLVARVLWVIAVGIVAGSAVLGRRRAATAGSLAGGAAARARPDAARTAYATRPARLALVAAAAYIALMVGADAMGRGEARRAAARAGLDVRQLMVAPAPANPLAADIVVDAGEAYHLGRLDWTRTPRVTWRDPIPLGERSATVLATLQLQEVRDFLRWSRFPYVEVREAEDGHMVRFGDARYPGGMRGGLSGVVVHVASGLRVRSVP